MKFEHLTFNTLNCFMKNYICIFWYVSSLNTGKTLKKMIANFVVSTVPSPALVPLCHQQVQWRLKFGSNIYLALAFEGLIMLINYGLWRVRLFNRSHWKYSSLCSELKFSLHSILFNHYNLTNFSSPAQILLAISSCVVISFNPLMLSDAYMC